MGQVISMRDYRRKKRLPDSVAEILGIVARETRSTNFAKDSRLKKLFDAIKKDPARAAALLSDR